MTLAVTGKPDHVVAGVKLRLVLVVPEGCVIVMLYPLLTIPPEVTTTGPVVAPAGTVATMLFDDQEVALAATSLKVTLPEAPKLTPVIVTESPMLAEGAERLLMNGSDAAELAQFNWTVAELLWWKFPSPL
jgi:hypothetical protein